MAHVASDNVQGGFQAGKLICTAVGKTGSIAIVDEPEVTSVQDRVKGFKQAIAQLCPGVTIVADVDSGGTRDKANSDTGDILQAHRDLKGIFGINDDSALGALAAVQAAGLVGKVAVVGYDATPEARKAIAGGQMYGDAIQYPAKIGAKTIDVIHDYFGGKAAAAGREDSRRRPLRKADRRSVPGRRCSRCAASGSVFPACARSPTFR